MGGGWYVLIDLWTCPIHRGRPVENSPTRICFQSSILLGTLMFILYLTFRGFIHDCRAILCHWIAATLHHNLVKIATFRWLNAFYTPFSYHYFHYQIVPRFWNPWNLSKSCAFTPDTKKRTLHDSWMGRKITYFFWVFLISGRGIFERSTISLPILIG